MRPDTEEFMRAITYWEETCKWILRWHYALFFLEKIPQAFFFFFFKKDVPASQYFLNNSFPSLITSLYKSLC